MSSDSYLRYPTIHDDAVVFVAEDDLWSCSTAGGRAYRITADRRPVRSPRLSPDGSQVAWSALVGGISEVYVGDLRGGGTRRLTFWGQERTFVRGWLSEREVLVVSSTGQAERSRMFAHAVPVDGSPSRRLPFGWVHDLSLGAGKGVLLSTATTVEPAYWKGYRGGTAAQLWLDNAAAHDGEVGKYKRLFADLTSSLVSPLLTTDSSGKRRVGFISDHEGRAQVYSAPVSRGTAHTEDLHRHTDHDFYARHASTDGRQVVYATGGELWLLPSLDADAEPAPLDIELAGPRAATRPVVLDLAGTIDHLAPDRTGRASVVGARGSVHWLPHRQGASRVLADGSGIRRREPIVLGETKRVVWVSDIDGEDAVEILDIADPAARPRTLVRGGNLGRVHEIVASPDGSRLAVASHDGRLSLIDVPASVSRAVRPRVVTTSPDGDVSDLAFSPDSRWLAWSHPGPDVLAHVRLVDAVTKGAEPVDVTALRFNDFSPSFSHCGKYLAFLSYRSLDPVYDSFVFDLSFPGGCRPYLVPLAAATPSPFDAAVDGLPLDGDEGVPGPENPDDTAKERKDEDKIPATTIDPDDLEHRLVPFPVNAGRMADLRCVQGGAVWLTHPARGELGEDLAVGADAPSPSLHHIDFGTGKTEVLVETLDDFAVTGDGSRMVVHTEDALKVLPATRHVEADAPEVVEIDLTRSTVTIEPREEWRQMYDETWRLMRLAFWREDMDGVDWEAAYDRYLPMLAVIGSHDDLVDVLWELHGELGSSHAYVTPVPHPTSPVGRQGLLGADLDFVGGQWVVSRIVPGETSARGARSPLLGPGAGVRPGDAIVAVAGRPTGEKTPPGQLLIGMAEKPTELLIRPAEKGSAARRVIVTPLADEFPLRYQDWVRDRREYVHAQTDGQIGYLHVPDMVSSGWAQLHRDLRTEIGRDGVILDVRANRGGHTSQLIIEKVARTILGWDVSRGQRPLTYPLDARRGPLVAVTDMHAGSDGDIVTAAIRSLGLGPVVGTRTWGGVIGIDGRYTLVDGTSVTQPRYAYWFRDQGWGIENYGVEPDVEVPMSPQDLVLGNDVQLDKAIELVLAALAKEPAAQPPLLPSPRH